MHYMNGIVSSSKQLSFTVFHKCTPSNGNLLVFSKLASSLGIITDGFSGVNISMLTLLPAGNCFISSAIVMIAIYRVYFKKHIHTTRANLISVMFKNVFFCPWITWITQ